MQQTTTPSTRSICTPSSFEQQQPSKQILIQGQEASDVKAPRKKPATLTKQTIQTTTQYKHKTTHNTKQPEQKHPNSPQNHRREGDETEAKKSADLNRSERNRRSKATQQTTDHESETTHAVGDNRKRRLRQNRPTHKHHHHENRIQAARDGHTPRRQDLETESSELAEATPENKTPVGRKGTARRRTMDGAEVGGPLHTTTH